MPHRQRREAAHLFAIRDAAVDLITEDRNGREIAAQRQLMAGEQRSRRDRKVLAASAAAETWRALEAAAVVSVNPATVRADIRALNDPLAQQFSTRGLAQGLRCAGGLGRC